VAQLRVVAGGRASVAYTAERDGLSDRALLARVVDRDQAAHRLIFERYYKRVLAFVRRRVNDDGLAEEVAADVFYEVWRNAAAYRGESPVTTWVFGIANLKALSARRLFCAAAARVRARHTRRDALARARSVEPGRIDHGAPGPRAARARDRPAARRPPRRAAPRLHRRSLLSRDRGATRYFRSQRQDPGQSCARTDCAT
jgi:DNA-directed RNA polymerase specialized sigma24 family protein